MVDFEKYMEHFRKFVAVTSPREVRKGRELEAVFSPARQEVLKEQWRGAASGISKVVAHVYNSHTGTDYFITGWDGGSTVVAESAPTMKGVRHVYVSELSEGPDGSLVVDESWGEDGEYPFLRDVCRAVMHKEPVEIEESLDEFRGIKRGKGDKKFLVGLEKDGQDLIWHSISEDKGPLPMNVIPCGVFYGADERSAIEVARTSTAKKKPKGDFRLSGGHMTLEEHRLGEIGEAIFRKSL